MKNAIEEMLARYDTKELGEKKNAIKEITQEIVLCGLSRAGFFDKAAFYGGSALRIIYGLDRFSEDLDFSLLCKDPDFNITSYFPMIRKEAAAYGLDFDVTEKKKTADSTIRSAFMKGNTKEHILVFFPRTDTAGIPANELIKIKLEVNTDPAPGAGYEHRIMMLPSPYQLKLYDLPSLFAGKIHAVLCRAWKNRVKGRDLYDYVFYISRNAAVNMTLLQAKLAESRVIEEGVILGEETLKKMLCERFDSIDFNDAKEDVADFLKNRAVLDVWSADYFKQLTEGLCCL